VRGGRACRELGQAEARDAEGRAGVARDTAGEIVRRATRSADDDQFNGWRTAGEKGAGGVEPGGRGGRGDDAQVLLLPDAMPDTGLPRLCRGSQKVELRS
jgi:hypothetical protein